MVRHRQYIKEKSITRSFLLFTVLCVMGGVAQAAPFIVPNDQVEEAPAAPDPEHCQDEPDINMDELLLYDKPLKDWPVSPSGIIQTITPLECGIERPTPIEDLISNYYLPNGLEVFGYDSNHDGVEDATIFLPQNDMNRYPVIYMFDRDYDGDPDIKYTDQLRDGSCNQITWEKNEKNKGNSKLKES